MDFLWAADGTTSEGGSGFWLLVMVMMGIGFLGFFGRWMKRRRPALPKASELREREREPNRYRDVADAAIVELLETSRSLNAQVDNKIRLLNRLVKEAEASCQRLEKLLADAGRLEEQGLPAQPAVPEQAASVEDTVLCPAPGRTFLSELHERIYHLREEGRTESEIAKATNLSTTEVRFALESLGENHG